MVPVLGKSQRTRIEFNGDETFTYFQRPAEDAIFNGELFKEKERQFLKRNMRLHNVSFPIGHQQTVQIELKSFWQKESMNLNRRGLREGRFVTLLSDQRPPIEDALAWVKLVWPLYKKGFSVLLLDLPGAGGSGVNADPHVSYELWEQEDFRIVESALRGLSVTRTHLIAFGRSCRIILKFAKHAQIDAWSSFVAKEHCWYQPDIDFFALFQEELGDCPPGHVQEWRLEAVKKQQHLFRELLKSLRLMSFFDPMDPAVQATQSFILRARSVESCLAEFSSIEVTEADICTARAHASLPVRVFMLSKNLMGTMGDFLLAEQKEGVLPTYMPHHAIQETLQSSPCKSACLNPARGLHHWACPNHPKNKAAPKVPEPSSPPSGPTEEERVPLGTTRANVHDGHVEGTVLRPRPASAPAHRNRASLEAAMHRDKSGAARTWVVDSQKNETLAITSQQATMRACSSQVKRMTPAMTPAQQHEEFVLKLPANWQHYTRAHEKVFQRREAVIEKAKREEEELMKTLAFDAQEELPAEEAPSPSVDSEGWIWDRSMDGFTRVSERPTSKIETETWPSPVISRRPSPSPRSGHSSKLSFASTSPRPPAVNEPLQVLEEVPREKSDPSPTSSRQLHEPPELPESPEPPGPGTMSPSSTLGDPSPQRARPASAAGLRRGRPGSGKRPGSAGRPASASAVRPASASAVRPESASTSSLSRPSSATRFFQDFLSSKLSRVSRPSSALTRASSSTRLSSEVALGGSTPTGPSPLRPDVYGNLASWFQDRRSFFTKY